MEALGLAQWFSTLRGLKYPLGGLESQLSGPVLRDFAAGPQSTPGEMLHWTVLRPSSAVLFSNADA